MQTDEVSIKHQFEVAELAQMGRAQAESLDKLGTLKAELESVKKQYNAQIAEQEAAVSRISSKVHAGWEMRTVKCCVLDERIDGYRLVVRLDSGHIVKRRKLEPSERQIKITTEAPKQYWAVATLHVDDDTWDVDAQAVPLYEDEFDALRTLDVLGMVPYAAPNRRLHDASGNQANATRPIPTDPNAPEWRTQDEIAAGVPHHVAPATDPDDHRRKKGRK